LNFLALPPDGVAGPAKMRRVNFVALLRRPLPWGEESLQQRKVNFLYRFRFRLNVAMFFSFDGIDGVGKSTQLQLFCNWLCQRGAEVVMCRDPGSTALGESVRKILLEHRGLSISPMAEMLLYMAARAELVEQTIQPALAAGKTVVSDRYLLANVVYQGHAKGLDVDRLWEIGNFITRDVSPELTFLLDMPASAAQGRIQRALDRMEQHSDDFRERLRSGFLAEAARNSKHIVVIDAGRSIEAVQADIRAAAERILT
jgi:dTMP kinase